MLTKTRFVLAVHELGVSIPFYRDTVGMSVDFCIERPNPGKPGLSH